MSLIRWRNRPIVTRPTMRGDHLTSRLVGRGWARWEEAMPPVDVYEIEDEVVVTGTSRGVKKAT